jgi:hypothetical protein
MQQISSLRNRWNPKGQWIQLGVLSATIVTPLLSRWNELRAAERARLLREEAEDRLRGARALLPQSRREAQHRMDAIVRQATDKVASPATSRRLSSTLWLTGAVAGLAVAGVTAYIIVRRQLAINVNEPFVILPTPSRNGHDQQRVAPTSAPATDRPIAALAEQASAASTPATDAAAGAPATTTATEEASLGVEGPAQAKFIGNVRTMVFHDADAKDLPAEENRVYFASAEDARLAGYRRDRDEVVGEPESEARATE